MTEGRRAAPAVLLSTLTYGLRRLSAKRWMDVIINMADAFVLLIECGHAFQLACLPAFAIACSGTGMFDVPVCDRFEAGCRGGCRSGTGQEQ
jgi:hypothetical protein